MTIALHDKLKKQLYLHPLFHLTLILKHSFIDEEYLLCCFRSILWKKCHILFSSSIDSAKIVIGQKDCVISSHNREEVSNNFNHS